VCFVWDGVFFKLCIDGVILGLFFVWIFITEEIFTYLY
jgi:hypothetical protein